LPLRRKVDFFDLIYLKITKTLTMKVLSAVLISLFFCQYVFSQSSKLDSLEKAVAQMPGDTNKVKALIDVAQGYVNSDAKKAEKYGKESLALAEKLNYTQGRLVGAIRTYYYLFLQSKYDEAEKEILKGLKLTKETGNLEFEGRLSNSMAQNLMAKMSLKESIEYGLKALEIGNKLDVFRIKKNALKNIGSAYTYLGNLDKGLEYNQKALDYSIEKNEKLDQAMAYNDISMIYTNRMEFGKNLGYAQKAASLFEELGDVSNTINSLTNLAGAYLYLGNRVEGQKYLDKAYKLSQGKGFEKQLNNLYLAQGIFDNFRQDFDSAEKNLNMSLQQAQKFNYGLLKQRSLRNLANLYYVKKEFSKALRYEFLAQKVLDSLTTLNNNNQIAQMEAKYNLAEKEAQLAQSKYESAQRRNWIIGLSLGFLAILITGGLLWNISNIKTKAAEAERLKNLEIESQNRLILAREVERKRIAKELHDSVGSQLTVVSTSLDNAFYLFENQKLKPEKLENISGEVRLAAQSLRDTIWATYNTEITVADLKSRIQEFVKKFADENTFKVEMDISGDGTILTPIEGLNLFRIVQEALNNTQKYAGASLVKITGDFSAGKYALEISDNGKGFDLEQVKVNESYGLNNMKTRTEEIGMLFELKSDASGTLVYCSKNIES
jgi:signal transduction histidine kinase